MARKNVLHYEVLTGQSLSSSFTSPVTFIKYLDNISYQVNVKTTNSTGTFAIQGSNDYNINEASPTVVNPGNWVTLPLGGGVPFANAANDNIIVDMNQVPFNALRLVYTSTTAGTGTCDAWIVGKQIGG
jgi:hypothetical protein